MIFYVPYAANWDVGINASNIATFFCLQYDESTSQERLERKIKNAPPGQGTVRMLTREEWEVIKDLPPRTPFESKLARSNAQIRTGEPVHLVNKNSLWLSWYDMASKNYYVLFLCIIPIAKSIFVV